LNHERDMRSPGGVLGMTMNEKADLSSLTYSIMEIEQDDLVFLTTNGISDNYDPCVSRTALLSGDMSQTLSTPYERHLSTLHHLALTIRENDHSLIAFDLCHRILQYVLRSTGEQLQTIEQDIRENQGVQGSARVQFELEMHEKVEKSSEKLDHASIVAYRVT
jgi:hypothetical protein